VLLEILEDGSACISGDDPAEREAITGFHRAIAALQSVLGVPEDRRAWNSAREDLEDEPLPVRVQDAKGYAAQAGSLVPMFLSVLDVADMVPEAERVCVRALAERFADTIATAQDAPTVEAYAECIEGANSLLDALTKHMETASDVLWGLVRGITASLEDAELDMELEAERAGQATAAQPVAVESSDEPETLADLPGPLGERADIALGCASEIEQAAAWLLAEVARRPFDYERPFTRLLKVIYQHARTVLSAVADESVTLEQLREKAA
jgi:hypothetical protein